MLIKTDELNNLIDSYWQVVGYQKQIKELYQFLDAQFKAREYGVKLEPIRNGLFAISQDYDIYEKKVYPIYLWVPQWYGRFYVNSQKIPADTAIEDCPIERLDYIAFVWNWIGCNDPHVPDTKDPECWLAVTKPEVENPSERLEDVAENIWNHFRLQLMDEETEDGWLKGHFDPHKEDCNLKGWWLLRRLPLSQVVSCYQVQQLVVKAICEKYNELSNSQS